MDRRQFLTRLVGADPQENQSLSPFASRDAAFGTFANASLPARKAVAGGLEGYQGSWSQAEASHLLRRALCGFGAAELEHAVDLGAVKAIDALMDFGATDPAPPLNVSSKETAIGIGTTWVDQLHDGNLSYDRSRNLQAWWMGLFLEQGFSIREKMTLFWHNHFATDWRTVGQAHHVYNHLKILRSECLGSFKLLAKHVTLDPAMLRYLNGNTNTKGNPNENYARELQELFTIGKGPEIAPGNYTNYTEDDVRAAARVLTGWRDLNDTSQAEFRSKQHDIKDKPFSAAYGSTIIKGREGAEAVAEIDDLIEMIFSQAETSRYICRKLYRYFVYYVIDDDIESRIIQPLADQLVAGGWAIAPVVATLLKSAHFHDPSNRGCFIKTPLDLVVGTLRSLGSAPATDSDLVWRYQAWLALIDQASGMQMDLLSLPDVAGWPAFHQNPVFYQAWISSDTLPRRVQFTDRCLGTKGYQIGSAYMVPDLLGIAESVSDPSDLSVLINEISVKWLPMSISDSQRTYLKGVLLAGAPEYEWGNRWSEYKAAPTDVSKRSVVETRLRALLKALMAMSEYQLC